MNADNPQSGSVTNPEAGETPNIWICPTCGLENNPNAKIWVYCEKCKTWYHDVCEGIEHDLGDNDYICTICSNKRKLHLKGNQCRKSSTNCETPRQ